jgi:hypothetical protein
MSHHSLPAPSELMCRKSMVKKNKTEKNNEKVSDDINKYNIVEPFVCQS